MASSKTLGAIAGVTVVWIATVLVGTSESADEPLLGVANFEWVIAVLVGLYILVGFLLLLLAQPQRRDGPPPKGGGWQGLIFLLTLIGLIIWKPDAFRGLFPVGSDQDEESGFVPGGGQPSEDELIDEPVEVVAQLMDLVYLGAAVAAIALLFWWLSRRNQSPNELEPADSLDAVDASAEEVHALEADLRLLTPMASQELRDGADPRAAVIRAYAILESAVGQRGWPRLDAETTTEHINRALGASRIDVAPFVRLGQLYDRARYSEHPISRTEQLSAADMLDAAHDALVNLG